MRAKGIVRKVIPWRNARRFFYWRLKKGIIEDALARSISATQDTMTFSEGKVLVSTWYNEYNDTVSRMESPNTDWDQEVEEMKKFVSLDRSRGGQDPGQDRQASTH